MRGWDENLTSVENFEKVEGRVASVLNVMTYIGSTVNTRYGGTTLMTYQMKPARIRYPQLGNRTCGH